MMMEVAAKKKYAESHRVITQDRLHENDQNLEAKPPVDTVYKSQMDKQRDMMMEAMNARNQKVKETHESDRAIVSKKKDSMDSKGKENVQKRSCYYSNYDDEAEERRQKIAEMGRRCLGQSKAMEEDDLEEQKY